MRPFRTLPHVLALAALVCSSADGIAEAAAYRGVAGIRPGHVAWIFRQPDTAAAHVGYLRAGALRIRTLECRKLASGGWCQVTRRGTRGWIQDRFLKAGAVMRG